MYHSIGDANYWCEIHGTGEPLVLLHGFTGSCETWRSFIADWQKDFKLVMVDLPGHGKTDAPHVMTMEEACYDLHQLFSRLGLDTFHLLGYSMGGRTAISYAMYYPGKIKSLILESASPGLDTEEARKERRVKDENLADRIEKDGLERFVNFWENIPLFETQQRLPAEKKIAIREERLTQSKTGLSQSLRAMGTGSQPSWWKKLSDITIPVFLLAGALDPKFTDVSKRIYEHLPNSGLKIIANAGHAIHVEQPDIFGKIVKSFIFNT
ncbi:2-succinyl-6-hydroxy-2,4-cyclohexadiene-1-carboxylate synthase [Virgibacillus oceani]